MRDLLKFGTNQPVETRLKTVLVINYSQTGQLAEITEQVISPLRAAGHQVHLETLVPETPFPWPWPMVDFIDAFPECVQLDPPPLKPLSIPADRQFDLVILTYQVWYLAPALPMTAFLKSPAGRQLLKDKPVVTLVACRNMWLSAQETMRRLIAEAGGQLRDHLAFTDQGHALATFITTPRWVLTGRRDRFLGLPPAGVAPQEIRQASRFGRALADALDRDQEKSGEPMLSRTARRHGQSSPRTQRTSRTAGFSRLVETHPRLWQTWPMAAAADPAGFCHISDYADRDGRSIKPVGTMVVCSPAQTAT
jgi:hypothetical protein